MWQLSQPWWEFVFRGIVIYFFIFLLLRFSGKKRLAQLGPFDLVLLLIISNAVQNSMNAGDNTITAGLILASTLVIINFFIDRITFKSRFLEKWIDGTPQVLIHNGTLYPHVLDREKISHQDLNTALHESGAFDITNVKYAILEPNGHISVVRKD